jgi:hypothetical protein
VKLRANKKIDILDIVSMAAPQSGEYPGRG